MASGRKPQTKQSARRQSDPRPAALPDGFYRAIFESSPDALLLADDNGHIIAANPAACALIGFSADELAAKMVRDLSAPGLGENHQQWWEDFLANGSLKRNFRLRHKDGTLIDLAFNARADIMPGVHLSDLREISAEKTMERYLHDEVQRFRLATQLGRIGVWDWDIATDRTIWSEEMYRIYGIKAKDFTGNGEDYIDFTHPEDREIQRAIIVKAFERAARQRNARDLSVDSYDFDPKEFRIMQPDGAIRYVEGDAIAAVNSKGVSVRMLGVLIDITERKEVEQELEQYRDRLEVMVAKRTKQLEEANIRLTELDKMKTRFLAEVSHEMGHPITTLKVYAALLERVKDGDLPRIANAIGQQADRLKTFLEDVLSLSRLDLAGRKIAFTDVKLNQVVEMGIKTFTPQADVLGLGLHFEADRSLPDILGEPNQLAEVVANLISNALRYTHQGSVTVSTAIDSGGVTLRVKDTGPGINEEDLPHIFERFYRGQNASETPLRGSGLGLSIVKEIVDIHHGMISVSSKQGYGSTFSVWLPVAGKQHGHPDLESSIRFE